jgi:hypothetical protein
VVGNGVRKRHAQRAEGDLHGSLAWDSFNPDQRSSYRRLRDVTFSVTSIQGQMSPEVTIIRSRNLNFLHRRISKGDHDRLASISAPFDRHH